MPDARDRLAKAQHALLASLVAAAEPPPGFDAGRIRAQVNVLIGKRRNAVAHVRPDLPRTLGPHYRELFDAYAATNPKPPGGSRADAEAFLRHVSSIR